MLKDTTGECLMPLAESACSWLRLGQVPWPAFADTSSLGTSTSCPVPAAPMEPCLLPPRVSVFTSYFPTPPFSHFFPLPPIHLVGTRNCFSLTFNLKQHLAHGRFVTMGEWIMTFTFSALGTFQGREHTVVVRSHRTEWRVASSRH